MVSRQQLGIQAIEFAERDVEKISAAARRIENAKLEEGFPYVE